MKKLLLAGLLLLVAGVGIGYYMWNKPHQDMTKAKPIHEVAADALVGEFQADETASNTKYLGKVIQVNGVVREASMNEDGSAQILLESSDLLASVSCNLSAEHADQIAGLKAGDTVDIKGECTGVLMDVVMERCVIVTKD